MKWTVNHLLLIVNRVPSTKLNAFNRVPEDKNFNEWRIREALRAPILQICQFSPYKNVRTYFIFINNWKHQFNNHTPRGWNSSRHWFQFIICFTPRVIPFLLLKVSRKIFAHRYRLDFSVTNSTGDQIKVIWNFNVYFFIFFFSVPFSAVSMIWFNSRLFQTISLFGARWYLLHVSPMTRKSIGMEKFSNNFHYYCFY